MMPLQFNHYAVVQIPVVQWGPSSTTGTQVAESTDVQALRQQVFYLHQQVQLQQAALRQLSPTQELQQNNKLQELQISQELYKLQPEDKHARHSQQMQHLQHSQHSQHSQQQQQNPQHPQRLQHPQHPQRQLQHAQQQQPQRLQQQQHHPQYPQHPQHLQQQEQRPCMQQQSQHEQLKWHAQHEAINPEVQVQHQSHQQKKRLLWLQLTRPPSFGKHQSDDSEDTVSEPGWPMLQQLSASSGLAGQCPDWESPEPSPRYWQSPVEPSETRSSTSLGFGDASPGPNSQQRQSPLAQTYSDDAAQPPHSQHEDYMTLMIRNIPARFTKAHLLRDFDARGSSGIDYFFQPVDLQTGKTKGMAFANFRSKAQAKQFQEQWHRTRLPNHGGGKVLDITAARMHGVTANLGQFKDYTLELLCKHDALPVLIDEYGQFLTN
ncbi:unnamed protein product [Polarella glacialis]|uniref:RRM domain-containing protein n=1 Tax=Polarella glacialis TaxID=89957 RepID=A0A813HDY0_POLGL|nr:unnamed protein product [Polarella glacialis]